MEIREFLDSRGGSPFASWFDDLDAQAAAKVAVALTRMERGNLSNAKGVGEGSKSTESTGVPATGVFRAGRGHADHPSVWRHKRRQQDDIAEAQAHWAEYKRRKKEEGDGPDPQLQGYREGAR